MPGDDGSSGTRCRFVLIGRYPGGVGRPTSININATAGIQIAKSNLIRPTDSENRATVHGKQPLFSNPSSASSIESGDLFGVAIVLGGGDPITRVDFAFGGL